MQLMSLIFPLDNLSKILFQILFKILSKICETVPGGRADKRHVRAAARPAYQRRMSLLTRPEAGDPPPTSG